MASSATLNVSSQALPDIMPTNMAYMLGKAELATRGTASRKQAGQFLTSPKVALYMAESLGVLPEEARVLDPAIGSGVLPCAVIEQAVSRGYPKQLHIIGYDTDAGLCELARTSLQTSVDWAATKDVQVTFEVHNTDFLMAHLSHITTTLFENEGWQYDAVISNPPYFKLNKTDSRAVALSGVMGGATNIYTLFMGSCARLLLERGRSVFIVPRSFCSGTYFARFRSDFVKEIAPLDLHVFDSRKEAFKEDAVLQENIILTFERPSADTRWQSLQVTSSRGATNLSSATSREIQRDVFLTNKSGGLYFRLPTSELDEHILQILDGWDDTLHSHNFEVSTGPVVPFRARSLMSDADAVRCGDALPLYWMQNVDADHLTWPADRGNKAQGLLKTPKAKKLLVEAHNYVLIRRFSSKEERRRLTAAPFLAASYQHDYVAFENHLNYLYRTNAELSEDETRGLSALMNSAIIDRYFRILNGHTQVNATDLRNLPLPPLDIIEEIGRRITLVDPTQRDNVVFEVLHENQTIPQDFPRITETRLGMGKIQEAQDLLKTLGLPKKQQNEMAALTLLSLAQLSEDTPWSDAEKKSLGIHDIMREMAARYDRHYAENTRETVRRSVIHQFEQAGIVERNPDDPELATNSPRTHYALSPEMVETVQAFDSSGWIDAATKFLENQRSLIERYQIKRQSNLVPLKLPTGEEYHLSPGAHNVLQVAIIEKFGPQFAPGARPLYVGDTADKTMHIDEEGFAAIGIPTPSHDKLPDVVLYDKENNWVYLIEAVTSHGPVSPKRIIELRELVLKGSTADPVFVTAFPDFRTFKDYLLDIAWETEVWLSDQPMHMIHFNGDKFLGPH